ncbi:MAG TPA: exodeoxyribonuclease VII small subunit [Terriglobales bacterium]|nr:exodeoxyribonuclease VII small subunit [Terriglobales bacterium]
MPSAGGFEHSLQRLEAIVGELERADLPLEKSVSLFEEGMALVEECRKQLDAAEGKVEALVRRAGGVAAEPFSLSEESEGGAEER